MLYYDRTEFSKEIDVGKTNCQKSTIFVTIGIFQIMDLSFNQMYVMNVIIY